MQRFVNLGNKGGRESRGFWRVAIENLEFGSEPRFLGSNREVVRATSVASG